jgi:hypothetical protein
METVQVQLPLPLVQRINQALSSNETLNQIIAEAVQMWLTTRRKEQVPNEQMSQLLREAGLAMSAEKQRALAEAMISKLDFKGTPTFSQVEPSLSKLKVPLSEEIIAMRGED